jgi:hypothetical protein
VDEKVHVMDKPIAVNSETKDAVRQRLQAMRREVSKLSRVTTSATDINLKAQALQEASRLQQLIAADMKTLGMSELPPIKGKRPGVDGTKPHLMPTNEMTVEQMLTLAAAGQSTPEGLAALEKAAVALTSPLVTPWVPPQFPPMPDASAVAAFFNAAHTMTPLQGVLRSPKDPHFKKEGGLKNLATVAQPPQYVGQDAEWIALLQQVPARFKGDAERVSKALQAAVSTYCVTSGPLEGWLLRLKLGDDRPHPNFVLTGDEKAAVTAVLPWAMSRTPTFKDRDLLEILRKVRIHATASSGMPRNGKKGVVVADMMKDAAQYYDLLTQKKLPAFQRQFPGEFLTLAKAKLDRYEIHEWGQKIRPYYCINGGLGLLYSAVVQAYSSSLLGFWEDDRSCNAHGFAWNSGGGNRLYSWVNSRLAKGPGVHAIGYSDDGLWTIVTEDGAVLVSDKDIAQQDASCGNAHLPQYREHLLAVLEQALNEAWKMVALAAVTAVFKQLVLLYKSLVYASENKIHSGVPGTAEADQVAFATFYVLIKIAYAALPKEMPPLDRFAAAEEQVSKRIGLRFKLSQWHVFAPEQETYPWTFLGKQIVRYQHQYVPVVPFEKAVVQLVTPKKNMGGVAGQRAWMERARGLAVTSLYWHPVLYAMAKAAYERKADMGIKPAATFEGEDEDDLAQILGTGVTVQFPDDSFPKWEWIMQLYTGLVVPGRSAEQVVVVKAAKSAADYFDEFFPEAPEPVPGAPWADSAMETEERLRALKILEPEMAQRLDTMVLPVAASAKEQYQMAPLSAAVKAAWNAERVAYYRKVNASTEKRRKGFVRGGAVERLEDANATVVFTAKGMKLAWEGAWEEDFGEVDPNTVPDEDWQEPIQEETQEEWGRRMEAEGDAQIQDLWEKHEKHRLEARGAGKRQRRDDDI